MYVLSDFALECKILNCSNWILPRETREVQDAIKNIQEVIYQKFLYSFTKKGTSWEILWEYIKSLKSVLLKTKRKLKFHFLLETE